MVVVPKRVREAARKGLKMKKAGMKGGDILGVKRAKGLVTGKISKKEFNVMKGWFARHLKTSRPGYQKWVKAGKPVDGTDNWRGAVAWLLWGGDPALFWVKS